MAQTSPPHFVSVHASDAIYTTAQAEQPIVLEWRLLSDRSQQIFTAIDGQPVRAPSIQNLILARADCLSLSLSHSLNVAWDNSAQRVALKEIYRPTTKITSQVSIELVLTVNQTIYSSNEVDSITEAIRCLADIISPHQWRLQCCLDCKFSYPAFPGPIDDREELRCYRDVPEAWADVQQNRKFAASENRNAGDYFVNAFHRCAAWA